MSGFLTAHQHNLGLFSAFNGVEKSRISSGHVTPIEIKLPITQQQQVLLFKQAVGLHIMSLTSGAARTKI